MSAEIRQLRQSGSPQTLAENFLELAQAGKVQWAVMVIVEMDGNIRYEWSRLHNNLAAIGAVEMLKEELKQHF